MTRRFLSFEISMVMRRYLLNEGHGFAERAQAYNWTSTNIEFDFMERRTRCAWDRIDQEESGYRTVFIGEWKADHDHVRHLTTMKRPSIQPRSG